MSANDYVATVRASNPGLFSTSDRILKIRQVELLKQIARAFEAGEAAGRNATPLFDSIFGQLPKQKYDR